VSSASAGDTSLFTLEDIMRAQYKTKSYNTSQTNTSLKTDLGPTAEICFIYSEIGTGNALDILDASGGNVVLQMGVNSNNRQMHFNPPLPVNVGATGLHLTSAGDCVIGIGYLERNVTGN
jgi:hypothetical protein